MNTRIIATTSRLRSVQFGESLMSLFALELLSPSPTYSLISPWISDFVVMSNGFGQYRALLPEHVTREVRLSAVVRALWERGATWRILTRPDSGDFLARLPEDTCLEVVMVSELHEKSLVCQHFAITGSMNFTYTGTAKSDEQVRITTNRADVDAALLNAESRWQASVLRDQHSPIRANV